MKAQAERANVKPRPRHIFITDSGKPFILAENKVGAKITLYNADKKVAPIWLQRMERQPQVAENSLSAKGITEV
jgi:hypothetical protein